MELIMSTDISTEMPKTFDFNYDELKSYLENSLDHYNNLVVTEDDIQGAKSDRANLNKLRKALDDKRKDVKKTCLAPYEEFEGKIKELIRLIDEPISRIDGQIKALDEINKVDKMAQIQSLFNIYKKEHNKLAWLTLEQIFNEKWLNKSCSMATIEKEIEGIFFQVENNVKIIQAMKLGTYEIVAINTYKKTLDMSKVLEIKTLCEKEETVKPAAEEADNLKTMRVVFYETTPEFRKEMANLIRKYNIKCEEI